MKKLSFCMANQIKMQVNSIYIHQKYLINTVKVIQRQPKYLIFYWPVSYTFPD